MAKIGNAYQFGLGDNQPRITCEGIQGMFYHALNVYKGLSWVDRIAMRFDSTMEIEEYAWLGMPPAMRERLGKMIVKHMRENGMTIKNKEFEATLGISTNLIRRNKTQQIQMRVRDFARKATGHDAMNLSTFLVNGTGSTNGLSYDGQYFFDTDHRIGDSGTMKNLLTSSEVASLNVGTATVPTPAEVMKAVLDVIGYMLNYKDDQGDYINAEANEFLVMVGTGLMGPFAQAFTGKTLDNGSGAIDNTLMAMDKIIDKFKISLAVNPRVNSWTDKFAIFRTDAPSKPLIIQEEVPLSMDVFDENSEYARLNKEALFVLERTGNWGYGIPEYAALATFS